MQANVSMENNCMTVTVEGEINTITTPQLAQKIGDLGGVSKLVFEMAQVRYVSSAGLRLFLSCQRTMTASGGKMLIRNCNEFVEETFSSVGYDRIMTLETEGRMGNAGTRSKQ